MVWWKSICGAVLLCGPGVASLSAQPAAPSATSLWLSDGYGLFVEISDQGLQAYEVTSISCISAWSAERNPAASGAGETVYTGHDVLRLTDGPSGDVKRLHTDGTAADIFLHQTSKRPEVCTHTPGNSPQENYAIFWQTFAEHYAFFDLHHMDWQAVDSKFRPRVTSATTPKQLFGIFRAMIEPLSDSHTGVEAPDIKEEFEGRRPDPNHLEDEDWKRAERVIATRYVRGGLRSFCNGRVQFGMLAHSIGYLRVTAFYGYADYEYRNELNALQTALDAIFQDASKLSGLVIDVRLNHGGDDPLGLEIASRLTDRKYLAYSKVTRNNLTGALHFTDPQQCWVVPSSRPGFRGNVVLLTGPDTVSAGETFSMTLLGHDPHVTLVGQNTQGVFSDVLDRHLPNGWRFYLPDEVFLTSDGKAFDGTGIPPNTPIAFFSSRDLHEGRDAALDEAIRILRFSVLWPNAK